MQAEWAKKREWTSTDCNGSVATMIHGGFTLLNALVDTKKHCGNRRKPKTPLTLATRFGIGMIRRASELDSGQSELTTTSRSVKQIDRLVKTRSNCYRWMIHFPMALLHCEELNLDCYSTPPDPKGGIKLKSIEIKMRWTVARLKEIKETFGV